MTDILKIKQNGVWVDIPAIKGDTGEGVPTGGTTGQVLKKKSNTDYDTEWGTVDALPSQSGQSGKYLTTNGTTASWNNVNIPTKTSDLTNDSGYITSSYHDSTKYDASNPNGYTSNIGTVTSVNNVEPVNGNVTIETGGGMPIGTIYSVNCSSSYVPDGALPCDGTEYTKAQFNDLWTNYLNTVSPAIEPLLKTCTYADYQTAISTYGFCAKFAVDTVNNKFKVPKLKNVIYQNDSNTLPVKGNGIALGITSGSQNGGLTYHTGTDDSYIFNVNQYGQNIGNVNQCNLGANSNSALGVTTDSTKSGIVSDTTKINLTTLRYFVQVANGQINQSMMDWSAWASSLAGKANGVYGVKTTYVNGTSGYRIWSDGYCEQWGSCIAHTGGNWNNTITLIKTFRDTNYRVLMNSDQTPNIDWTTRVFPACQKSTGSFIYYTNFEGSNRTAYWEAKGYLADGQY